MSLDEVHIEEPELQIGIKREQRSLIKKSCSLEFLFIDFESNIREPGLFFHCQTLVALINHFDSVFEGLTLLY